MMNKLLTGIFATSGLCMLVGCGDTFDPHSDGRVGRILPNFDLDTQVEAPANAAAKSASRAGDGTISVTDLALRLTSADGSYENRWDSVADFPTSEDYPVGEYTLEAFYGNAGEEGFDLPYYYGSQNLTVLENKVTPVNLTATLANSVVTVRYTDAVKQYFSSYGAKVRSNGGDWHEVTADETRLLYVNPGEVDINVDVTRPTGVSASLNPFSFTAEARHHYYVTFDITGGAGDAVLNVTFDSSVETEEIEINVSDQILTAPAPTVALSGVGVDPIDIVAGSSVESPVRAVLTAQGGLKTARLITSSEGLRSLGWPEVVDFETADAQTLALLKQLGLSFPGLEGIKSQMAMIDFTNVIPRIPYVKGGDNTTTFTIEAKDQLTKVSDPAQFDVVVSTVQLTLGAVQPLYLESTDLTLMVSYNGNDLANQVKFSYFNERGSWTNMPVKEVKAVSRAMSDYLVTLECPADGDLRIRAICADVQTPTVDITRTELYNFSVDEKYIFATHGKAVFSTLDGSNAAEKLGKASIFISTDGKSYKEVTNNSSSNTLSLSSLQKNTTYYLKAVVDGIPSRPVIFKTETGGQIPNNDMETWKTNGNGNNWENWYIGESLEASVWGTNNPLTTSPTGTMTDFGYDKVSGTTPVDDGFIGKGACISTQGWGAGNTASGTVSGLLAGKCNYIDAGLLHLGSSRSVRPVGYTGVTGPISTDDLDCGMKFDSRPSKMKFHYKYVKKNNDDRAVAKVVVYSGGVVIAENNIELDNQAEWKEVELALNYKEGTPKADKIYVCFMSTNSEKRLVKDSANINPPKFGALGREQYYASRFYVDEINLEY